MLGIVCRNPIGNMSEDSIRVHLMDTDSDSESESEYSVSESESDSVSDSESDCWTAPVSAFQDAIRSGNEVLQRKALSKLASLAKQATWFQLAAVLPVVAELFKRSSSLIVKEMAAYCLTLISLHRAYALIFSEKIGEHGVIPTLLWLLPRHQGRCLRVLMKFLWVLVMFGEPNRVIVVRHGGLEVLINMEKSLVGDLRWYLLETVSALATLRAVRIDIFDLGGLPLLIESATGGNLISRARAAQAIGKLGHSTGVKQILVNLNVIPVLIQLMREGSNHLKAIAGNTLGIIASQVDFIRPVSRAGAIPLYAELLQGTERSGREIAKDVFRLLGLLEENALPIAEHLVRILRDENELVIDAAATVFADLPYGQHTKPFVRDAGAIPILVELLRKGYNSGLQVKLLIPIVYQCRDKVGRRMLADAGFIPVLVSFLSGESIILKNHAIFPLIYFYEDLLLRDRVSEVFNTPWIQNIYQRILRLRASKLNRQEIRIFSETLSL